MPALSSGGAPAPSPLSTRWPRVPEPTGTNGLSDAVTTPRGSHFGWQFEATSPGPFEYHTTQISDQTGGAITDMEQDAPRERVTSGRVRCIRPSLGGCAVRC